MTTLFVVPATGAGKADYTQAIEFATQPTWRSWQRRTVWTLHVDGIPSVPIADFYFIFLYSFEAGVLYWDTRKPRHFQNVIVSSSRKALVVAGLYQFATLADELAWLPEKWYGDMWGYGKAELEYTNGIRAEVGKYFAAKLCEYSGEPTFDIDISVSSLDETDVL